ncbi:MAG: hypothetical protein ACI865_003150 [Flavobacteriaceae bacterium]|jgi:hypothetical protein
MSVKELIKKLLPISITVFVSGALLGPLLTSLISLTNESWQFWLGFRIIWVVGGGIWFGLSIGITANYKPILLMVLGAVFGGMLSYNPLSDIISGPIHGEYISASTETRGFRRNQISGTLTFIDANNQERNIEPGGLHANNMENMLEGCSYGEVVVLIHMDILLSLECRSD